LFIPKTVLALRVGVQGLMGSDLPVQVLMPIGGSTTLRGSPQDRYLDKVAAVANTEVRFPIFWRFGGVAGFDFGKVWSELKDFDLRRWAVNPVAGLRFYMNTFVVRCDVGFGKETTGLYFNFGHVF
jgi:hemolysin activation/secretion protein